MTMNETTDLIAWDLAACLRQHRVTIREIARHMKITLKRVREVRAQKLVKPITAWNFAVEIKNCAALKFSTELPITLS